MDIGKWSERSRLEFIERLLFWRGAINRKDLMEKFGISAPQATNDMVNYSTLNAGCGYNVRNRRYEAGEDFEPLLIQPDLLEDARIFGSLAWTNPDIPWVAIPPQPGRPLSLNLFRQLSLATHKQNSLEIQYWSVKAGEGEWRRISPRTFAHDGLRWHVRAFCHKREEFRDFVIGRITKIRNEEPCPRVDAVDTDWVEEVTMWIKPNPELTPAQQKGFALDYGMKANKMKIRVPKALRLYTARRLGFVKDPAENGLPMLNELKQLQWYR